MKWINKGHEYDAVFENIKKLEGIYLFGAGHDGAMVKDILDNRYKGIKVLGFIDNDINKKGMLYKGLHVYSFEEIKPKANIGIVISFASEFTCAIDAQLHKNGWIKEVNFFHYEMFLSVLAAYEYHQLFIPSISILPTTKCNLRCEACLNFTTYIKHFTDRPIERLKQDIDLFFQKVDYVGLLLISGGEPFLYEELPSLIQYVEEHYTDKIYSLETVTNGTVRPDEKVLKMLQKSRLKITVDDYRDALPEQSESIECNLNLLCKYAGRDKIIFRKYDEWIDLYPFPQKQLQDSELVEKYDSCHVPWQEFRDGKLFSCNYAAFASVAEITGEVDPSETYDFTAATKGSLKEIMEFRLGYSEKGYVEFCRQCAGYLEINEHKVRPAIQKGS